MDIWTTSQNKLMYGIYNSMIYGSLVKCFYTQYTIKKYVEQQINKYYQSCRNWYTYIIYIFQFQTSKEHICIQNIL